MVCLNTTTIKKKKKKYQKWLTTLNQEDRKIYSEIKHRVKKK